jgi:hypothetical protein
MSYTGNEDQFITLETGALLTKNFRDSLPPSPTDPTIGFYFSKSCIQDILDQTNCVGLRIYSALDEDNKRQLVIVGVDTSENDLYEGLIGDRGGKCPPGGGASNPLNS